MDDSDQTRRKRSVPDHLRQHCFKAGNRAAVGHVKGKQAKFRDALVKCVTKDELVALGRRLLADALKGDNVAAKLLLGYLCGLPAMEMELPDNIADSSEESADVVMQRILEFRKIVDSMTDDKRLEPPAG